MPRRDSFTETAISAVLLARLQQTSGVSFTGGSGGAIPTIALQFDGTYWTVEDANTDTPDAYYTISGSNLFIDPDATSGEPISIVSGNIFVGT